MHINIYTVYLEGTQMIQIKCIRTQYNNSCIEILSKIPITYQTVLLMLYTTTA